MALKVKGNRAFDQSAEVNTGVIADTSAGVLLRRVRFRDKDMGSEFAFLTMEMSLPPGTIVELYRRRWDIEKVFDEFKNALCESKA